MNHAAIEAAARARYEMHNPPGKYHIPTWESLHKVDRAAMLKEAAVMIEAYYAALSEASPAMDADTASAWRESDGDHQNHVKDNQ